MIIPLRTDRPPRRTPVITQALVLINVAIYVAGLIGQSFNAFSVTTLVNHGHFDPQHFVWWQLFTSLFLHDPSSIWHLVFNMLFLWVFGPPVEDRLGRVTFLVFYLMGGAMANLAHMMISDAPVIGASGAVAALSGSFLALHPRSRIICFFLIGFGVAAIPSLLFIALYFLIDVLRQTMSFFGSPTCNVAYMAHIAGYVYGFALGFVLLATGVVPRDDYDVFFLFKQWRRRAALRQLNRASPTGVFESASADTGQRLTYAKREQSISDDQRREADLRSQINRLAGTHDLSGAAAKYRELLAEAPAAVFIEDRQLELANQLYFEHFHAQAAIAYELLLEHYPTSPKAVEVRLILAVLYTRHLQQPQKARSIIAAVKQNLQDPAQTALADQLLAELP